MSEISDLADKVTIITIGTCLDMLDSLPVEEAIESMREKLAETKADMEKL